MMAVNRGSSRNGSNSGSVSVIINESPAFSIASILWIASCRRPSRMSA